MNSTDSIIVKEVKGNLEPMARPGTHKRVLDLMRDEPKGKVLDLGTGKGNISARLKKLGFGVIACDVNPEIFAAEGIRCDRVNLNQKLPYQNNSFDDVILVEVIEHLENPHHIMREIARILKPGGKLILTTPNIANFYSRLYFLKTGFYSGFPQEVIERQIADIENGKKNMLMHVRPICWWELRMLLAENKLSVEHITINDSVKIIGVWRRIAQFMYPLLAPFLLPREPAIMKAATLIIKAQKHV